MNRGVMYCYSPAEIYGALINSCSATPSFNIAGLTQLQSEVTGVALCSPIKQFQCMSRKCKHGAKWGLIPSTVPICLTWNKQGRPCPTEAGVLSLARGLWGHSCSPESVSRVAEPLLLSKLRRFMSRSWLSTLDARGKEVNKWKLMMEGRKGGRRSLCRGKFPGGAALSIWLFKSAI